MARKMHCTLHTEGNDSPKDSEAGKESTLTIHQQENKSTSLEVTKDCEESSLSVTNSHSRCAIITFLSFESDGNWRIVALPVQCFNHVNLTSGVNMDGLQLLFPPPPNRLKIDQCKGSRGPLPPCAYSVKPCPRRSFTGSNVHRRCQNKVANKASKLNELPKNSCPQSSLVSSSPSLFPHSSAVVNSPDKCNTKEDKSLKKNARKRTKKKVRQSKKPLSDCVSTEREVHTEECVSVSLTSETCSSNDVDKEIGLMLYTTAPELSPSDDRIIKTDCERNAMNENISVTETPKNSASIESKDQLQDRSPDLTVIDREAKDIQDVELCCFDDIQDTVVLDSVSISSKSDESTSGGNIGKQSIKESCGITSNSVIDRDGFFLSQNSISGFRNNSVNNEGMRSGGQNCTGGDKRVKQKRTISKSSSFNKFGKESSHSVWQKVQKNSSDESSGDSKKVNTATSSHVVSTVEKDPSAVKKCKSVSPEDKKQLKNKVGRKPKGKIDSVSGKGQCNYSRKGSNLNKTLLNDNVKVSIQQNESSNISSEEINQQGLSSVSEIVHSAQFCLEESDIEKAACCGIANTKNENIDIQDSSLAMPGENINQFDMSDAQSPVFYNLLDNEVSSADFNAQNHSSGSTTLWKWIPVGKKDVGCANSESNSSLSEYSDVPPSKIFNLENNLESKIAFLSQNVDSLPNTSIACKGEIYNKTSCSDEGENHKLVGEHQDMLENDSYRITQAVNNVCRAQLACEGIHMATGSPVAEFERLLHFCSPVISQLPNSLSCLTCARDHSSVVSLCRHEMPSLSLGCLWQWYEKHSSYGLEIRAQEYENPKKVDSVGPFPFRAYFVPSLSAVQLFKKRESRCVNNSENFPNCTVSDTCEMIDISEDSSTASNQAPEMAAPINNACNPSIVSTCYGDLELLFEYFEYEQPQQRRPLYDKIQQLVRGDISMQSKTDGDPTKLDSINLRDIHPRSWYSVAWYPIYRIPDDNFRASFLTYHSLGHLVRRSSSSNSPTVDYSSIVSPTVGLQSYNAQGECWFQLNPSAKKAELLGINPSILLKERLRTLEKTASLMARAVVNKGNQICTNRHPDYEFFVSRRRY